MAEIGISTHLPVLDEPHEREAVGHELETTLHELVDLSLIGKQLHWAVVGPLFRPLHLHLDELVDSWRELSDAVAERERVRADKQAADSDRHGGDECRSARCRPARHPSVTIRPGRRVQPLVAPPRPYGDACRLLGRAGRASVIVGSHDPNVVDIQSRSSALPDHPPARRDRLRERSARSVHVAFPSREQGE